jgi:Protein of unknown function (DUF4199)
MKIAFNVKLGVIAGLINCLVWYLVAKTLGFYSPSIYSYRFLTTLLLLLVGIFISIYAERRRSGGFLEFKQAMKTGFLYTLTLSFIVAAFALIYHKFIVPDAIDFFVSEERKAQLADNRSLEDINKYIVEYYIPQFGAFHTLMTSVIWGILLSLLGGAIFSKKKPAMPFSAN